MSYSVVIGLLIFFGLLLCWLAILNLRHRHGRMRRPLRAGFEGLLGGLLLALAGVGIALVLNLHTYERLTADAEVAELYAQRNGPQDFTVEIRYRRNHEPIIESYQIRGEQWELDARVLKWHPDAAFFGLHTYYQLERFEGRYQNTEQEQTAQRTVYDLFRQTGLSLRLLAERYGELMPFHDSTFGNSVYMNLVDEGRYEVRIGQTGLFARATNQAALAANPKF